MSGNSSESPLKVVALGAGNMGGAVVVGLTTGLAAAGPPLEITCVTRSGRADIGEPSPIATISSDDAPTAARQALWQADLIILGVKPAQIRTAAELIAGALSTAAESLAPPVPVVSLAVGVNLQTLQTLLPPELSRRPHVARAMPNLPIRVGYGMTVLAYPENLPTTSRQLVETVFSRGGKCAVVPEALLDRAAAVSGSGPAYVYRLLGEATAAARQLGFSAETAALLVQQTWLGALQLLPAGQPEELLRRVCSPRGTTLEALKALDAAHLQDVFAAAQAAALRRAEEIQREIQGENAA